MTDEHEVIIVGGGPAGTIAAIQLARAGRQPLLIEGVSPTSRMNAQNLIGAGDAILRDLNLSKVISGGTSIPCYGTVCLWGSEAVAAFDNMFHPHGHGWLINRREFDAALREEAKRAGVRIISGSNVGISGHDCAGWAIILRGTGKEEHLHAKWLIDATGRKRAVANWCKAAFSREDRLIVYHVQMRQAWHREEDQDGRIFIESEKDGWWYSSLSARRERVVAFYTDSDLSGRSDFLTLEKFMLRALGTRLIADLVAAKGYVPSNRPHCVNAVSGRLERFFGDGWMATGDAALALDPLSSQGLLNGIYSGVKAATALDGHLRGRVNFLENYHVSLELVHAGYHQRYEQHYASETRWRNEPFWSRRRNKLRETNVRRENRTFERDGPVSLR